MTRLTIVLAGVATYVALIVVVLAWLHQAALAGERWDRAMIAGCPDEIEVDQ